MKDFFVEDQKADSSNVNVGTVMFRICTEFYRAPFEFIGGAALEILQNMQDPIAKKGKLIFKERKSEAYLIEDAATETAVVYYEEEGTWYAR